jgi:hypothetical protein
VHPQEVVKVYQQRVTVRPHPEKIAEARALLVARAKATQAAGQRIALGELVAGQHGPEFQVILLFDDLAAFEAARRRNQADTTFQKFTAKLASVLREPAAVELFEVLVVMPGVESATPKRVASGSRVRRKAT